MNIIFLGIYAVVILLQCPQSPAPEQGLHYVQVSDPSLLKGPRSIYVLVESLPSGIEKEGLSKDAIQTDVELKLRQSGIHIMPKEEFKRKLIVACLYVNINILKTEQGFYAANVQVCLQDTVCLGRSPDICIIGSIIWDPGDVILAFDPSKLLRVRECIKDQVDKFCNAYLSVNPKP